MPQRAGEQARTSAARAALARGDAATFPRDGGRGARERHLDCGAVAPTHAPTACVDFGTLIRIVESELGGQHERGCSYAYYETMTYDRYLLPDIATLI